MDMSGQYNTGPGPCLAFDLGGTWLRAALAAADGALLRKARRPTPRGGPAMVLAAMVALAEAVDPDRVATAVGVAAPGPLDPAAGRVLRMPNLPGWEDVPLASLLAEALGRPVRLQNDASLAALAEGRLGAGRGADPLVYLTLSTGIGGGILVGGRLLEGHRGLAGELGHILLETGDVGPTCGLGHGTCVEALASGTALARRAMEALAAGSLPSDSPLVALAGRGDVDAGLLAEAARLGDVWCLELWTKMGQTLARGLASLICVLDPARIVLGGGLMSARDLWEPALRASLPRHVIAPAQAAIPIVAAALGDDAGLVGAALWAADEGWAPAPGPDAPRYRTSP